MHDLHSRGRVALFTYELRLGLNSCYQGAKEALAMLSVCGLVCNECEAFGENCKGCIEMGGKPSWAQDVGIEKCQLFECCEIRGFMTCGECESLPCKPLVELRDPRITPEAHLDGLRAKVSRLRNHRNRTDHEVQIHQLDEVTFVGFALHTSLSASKDVIPRFWDDFWQTGKCEALAKALDVPFPEPLYGVCANQDPCSGAYTYLAGARLPQGSPVPAGLDSVTLCPSLYGMVHLPMDIPQIQAAWCKIHTWADNAGFTPGFDGFECYPDDATCDVWMQIR